MDRHLYHRYFSPGADEGGGDPEDKEQFEIDDDGKITSSVPLKGGKEEEPEEPEHKPDNSEGDDDPNNTKTKYAGKSADELLKIIDDQEKFIGGQSTEIGRLRGDKATPESQKLTVKREELTQTITNLTSELEQLDQVTEPELYKETINKLKEAQESFVKTNDSLIDARVNEKFAGQIAEKASKEVVGATRTAWKELGMDFEDKNWEAIVSGAVSLAGTGNVTAEDIESSIIHEIGAENYRKVISGQAELDTRKAIMKNFGAIPKTIDHSTGDQKEKHVYDLTKMSQSQIFQVLDSMSPKQRELVYKKYLNR